MRRLTLALSSLLALPLVAVSLAALLGLGALRELPSLAASLGAFGLGLLPAMGLASMLGPARKAQPLVAALALWSVAVIVGLPLYFPDERAAAISTGFGLAGSPWGPEASQAAADWGEALAGLIGDGPQGSTPPPMAEPLIEDAPPAAIANPAQAMSTDHHPDEVALPYEGSGSSLVIPVTFEDKESVELQMIYDTGATLTTLSADALKQLGVKVPKDAPEITMQTANGERKARLVLLERVWLGGFEVEGVTVALCEACAMGDHAGLLGLNVTSRFTVTVDPSRRELVLRPRADVLDSKTDIGRWLDLSSEATVWSDGRVLVEVTLGNAAARSIAEVVVGVRCGDDAYMTTFKGVGARSIAEEQVSLPRGTECAEGRYSVSLESARW